MTDNARFPDDPPIYSAKEIMISDAHLLNGSSQAEYLLEFLLHSECRRLIIAGDFFDFWEAAKKKTWRPSETELRILEVILQKRKAGTEVIFIPGNHEEEQLRRPSILGRSFFGVSVVPKIIESDRVIMHGDEFDPFVVRWGRAVHATGAALKIFNPAYHSVIRSYNSFRKWVGRNDVLAPLEPYLPSLKRLPSLSRQIRGEAKHGDIERKETKALHSVHTAALDYMQRNGISELYFGHTHVPNEIRRLDGRGRISQRIVDSGDWIENRTFIADGSLQDWGDIRGGLGLNGHPATERYQSDAECREQAYKLYTAMYRLCPGFARSKKIREKRQHNEKAVERQQRAQVYRDFASAVRRTQELGDDMSVKLRQEFARLSEKCREYSKRVDDENGTNASDVNKLIWHSEIRDAVGQALKGNIERNVTKLKDAFERKAARMEQRAEESRQAASRIHAQLSEWRRFRPARDGRTLLQAA